MPSGDKQISLKLLQVYLAVFKFYHTFAATNTVRVAQLVRASDCGSEGRGFETRFSPGGIKYPEYF